LTNQLRWYNIILYSKGGDELEETKISRIGKKRELSSEFIKQRKQVIKELRGEEPPKTWAYIADILCLTPNTLYYFIRKYGSD